MLGRSPRRATGLGLALAIAVLTPGLAGTGQARADDPEPEEPQYITEAPLSIATFNVAAWVKTEKSMADITRLITDGNPDIVTLQEMGSPAKRQLVRATFVDCETCVYDMYAPLPATSASTPILFRTDRFALLKAESVQVTEPTFVGKKGAGPSTIAAKYVNRVALRDLVTKRRIQILNNHAVPSVQGRSGGPNMAMKARLGIYRKHMAGLRAVIERVRAGSGGLFLVTGDLNVNFRRDRVLAPKMFPYYNMGLESLRASYEVLGEPKIGTHHLGNGNDTRLIDYVYAENRRALQPVSQRIIGRMNSDHRSLLVTFRVLTMKPILVEPTEPTEPTDPTEPTEPTDPTTPTAP